jgi:hypothetical protein
MVTRVSEESAASFFIVDVKSNLIAFKITIFWTSDAVEFGMSCSTFYHDDENNRFV